MARTYFLALLAEAYGTAGQPEQGLNAINEALELVNTNGEQLCEAELYRLKGTLTLQSQASLERVRTGQNKSANTSPQHLAPSTPAEQEVEGLFRKAIAVAQQQQAKSLELRATTSLAHLWQ
jgi:hypothetical protein